MNKLYLIFGLLLCATICNAEEYRDTFVTADEDSITVTYDIQYKGDEVKITFIDVEKKLTRHNSRKYRKAECIKVAIFDRIDRHNIKFSGIAPNVIKVTPNLKYTISEKGYFFLEDKPTISFTIAGEGEKKVYIPFFLTYYESRTEREIFTGSTSFCIKLNPPIVTNTNADTDDISMSHTSTELKETISDSRVDSEVAESVYKQIDLVMELLEQQTKLPFSEILTYEIGALIQMKREVKDDQLYQSIQRCLKAYNSKKENLEIEEAIKEEQEKLEAERKEQEKQLQLQVEQERIAEEQRQLAEEQKKRSLIMTIGGILLAAICFIGNQVLQHFRNLRNQRSMLEMQQDITRRAEAEAKRHAQNYTRRKVSDVVNSTKQGTQNMVRSKVNLGSTQKSKKISI